MSTGQILLLGAIAGFTIFLGLPLGRMQGLSLRLKAFLGSVATGVLIFLLWDILSHGAEPIEAELTAAAADDGSWLRFVGLAALFCGGIGLGALSLVYFERFAAGGRTKELFGPGAMAPEEIDGRPPRFSSAASLALLIAIGIGLHNLSEGLAIGQAAASDELSLALALIIGFGLHNATEGFGILGPLAAAGEVPSWKFIGVLGLIGGGPTFVGTALGQTWTNDFLSVAFLALAAGSILFVICELLRVNQAFGRKDWLMWGLLIGLFAGFGTDWIIEAAQA